VVFHIRCLSVVLCSMWEKCECTKTEGKKVKKILFAGRWVYYGMVKMYMEMRM